MRDRSLTNASPESNKPVSDPTVLLKDVTRRNPPSDVIAGSAGLSRCGHYRYWLRRQWSPALPQCTFIGLNPSTADAQLDDPTLRRCIGFAKQWGYGSLLLVNLFAWRATDPRDLLSAPDPIGPQTNRWLRRAMRESDLVVAAWGNGGTLANRAHIVAKRLKPLHCLGITSLGMPRHPLYCRADCAPIRYLPS